MNKYEIFGHDPLSYIETLNFDGETSPVKLPVKAINSKQKVFQFDEQFPVYRNAKLAAKGEDPGKYYQTTNKIDKSNIYEYIINALVSEWPKYFQFAQNLLLCKLTGEALYFANKRVFDMKRSKLAVSYQDGIEALMCQVQEDLVIRAMDTNGMDYCESACVHFPDRYTADSIVAKPLDRSFIPLVSQFVKRGVMDISTYDKLVFSGFRGDSSLNNHPGHTLFNVWDAENPNLFARFQRQTFRGFPSVKALLITSKTYTIQANGNNYTKAILIDALERQADTADCEFLNGHIGEIIIWLQEI